MDGRPRIHSRKYFYKIRHKGTFFAFNDNMDTNFEKENQQRKGVNFVSNAIHTHLTREKAIELKSKGWKFRGASIHQILGPNFQPIFWLANRPYIAENPNMRKENGNEK